MNRSVDWPRRYRNLCFFSFSSIIRCRNRANVSRPAAGKFFTRKRLSQLPIPSVFPPGRISVSDGSMKLYQISSFFAPSPKKRPDSPCVASGAGCRVLSQAIHAGRHGATVAVRTIACRDQRKDSRSGGGGPAFVGDPFAA